MLLNTALVITYESIFAAKAEITDCIFLDTELNSTSPIRAVPATKRKPSGLKNIRSPPISWILCPSKQPTFLVIGVMAIEAEIFISDNL